MAIFKSSPSQLACWVKPWLRTSSESMTRREGQSVFRVSLARVCWVCWPGSFRPRSSNSSSNLPNQVDTRGCSPLAACLPPALEFFLGTIQPQKHRNWIPFKVFATNDLALDSLPEKHFSTLRGMAPPKHARLAQQSRGGQRVWP